jgi:hypothetical protein
LPALPATPAPAPVNETRQRVDEGIQVGRDWVNKQVPDGVLGRHTDSYRPNVDNLINTQQDNLKGYDSALMAEAARDQGAALAGAGRAFGGKVGGPAGATAMAPGLQNAAMQYQSGLTSDNADAKSRAAQALSEYLPRAAGEELKIDQDNRALGEKEHTIRAKLPFDIGQLLEGTRSGILGDKHADWLSELTKRYGGAIGNINAGVDKAQGR